MKYKETAIFFDSKTFATMKTDNFQAIYIGNEFCERLLPSLEEFKEILNWCKAEKIKLVLLSPFLTDKGIIAFDALVEIAVLKLGKFDVVVNDWGLLSVLEDKYKDINIYLGRILTSRYIFPLTRIRDRINVTKSYSWNFPDDFMDFCISKKINGFEFNSLKQLVNTKDQLRNHGLKINFYFPYIYITTTRLCNCIDGYKGYYRDSIHKCEYECKNFLAKMKNKMFKKNIISRGNAYFYQADIDMLKNNVEIDRIIRNDYIGKV